MLFNFITLSLQIVCFQPFHSFVLFFINDNVRVRVIVIDFYLLTYFKAVKNLRIFRKKF
jgi:hypothetical protein